MGLTRMPHGGDIPGIDADAERFGAFLLIAGVVLFVISAFYSATEFRYAAFGKSATATVQNVRRITSQVEVVRESISGSTFSSQTAACSETIVCVRRSTW